MRTLISRWWNGLLYVAAYSLVGDLATQISFETLLKYLFWSATRFVRGSPGS